MRIIKFRRMEECLWGMLFTFLLLDLVLFTSLPRIPYHTSVVAIAHVLSWPASLLLLLYCRRGRMSDQESQTSHLILGILGLLVGVVVMGFWLGLVVVWLGGLVFFLVVLFLSGRKLLLERKQKVLDRTENEKK